MFVPWWAIVLAAVAMIAGAYAYTRYQTNKLRKEIARLKEQLEREQQFSTELISLMPED